MRGAPGATNTAQQGSWGSRGNVVEATVLGGIAGPVYLGADSADQTPNVFAPKPVDLKQIAQPTPKSGPYVPAKIEPESLLYQSIPGSLWRRIRKWVHNDEASTAYIAPTTYNQTLNSTEGVGSLHSPIPIPVDTWISELLYRVYMGSASQRYEDAYHGGEAAEVLDDGELAGSLTPTRPSMQAARQNRLTGTSLLPTSPTLSRYQEVIGTGDLEGTTLY